MEEKTVLDLLDNEWQTLNNIHKNGLAFGLPIQNRNSYIYDLNKLLKLGLVETKEEVRGKYTYYSWKLKQ